MRVTREAASGGRRALDRGTGQSRCPLSGHPPQRRLLVRRRMDCTPRPRMEGRGALSWRDSRMRWRLAAETHDVHVFVWFFGGGVGWFFFVFVCVVSGGVCCFGLAVWC